MSTRTPFADRSSADQPPSHRRTSHRYASRIRSRQTSADSPSVERLLAERGPTIETIGLRCAYGAFEAVRGVDLAVTQGELYALLGTNGAGKTTLLETLEGHRAPTSGTVRVLGGNPRSAAVRGRMGLMPQESGFASDLTVGEALRLWSWVASRRDDDRAVLDRVGLAGRPDVRVSSLSGGERRRLDLALALYGRPDLLFLDEPTTGLDPESRAAVWDLVRDLLDDGVTIVLTTHYLEEAEALADRIGVMHAGRVVLEGGLDELLALSASRISFQLPADVPITEVPVPVDLALSRAQRVVVTTGDQQRDLWTLLDWARSRSICLDGLGVTEGSLDEIFRTVALGQPVGAIGPPGTPGSSDGSARDGAGVDR